MLKTFQTSKQQEGASPLTSVKTLYHQHYIIILIAVLLNSMFLILFFFYQYFALMLLLLLMELGVAIYLYIEKDKVSLNEVKDIFLSTK